MQADINPVAGLLSSRESGEGNQPRAGLWQTFRQRIGMGQAFNWGLFRELLGYACQEYVLFLTNLTFLLLSAYYQTVLPYKIGLFLDSIAG
jgi:ABC-type multidrug transport system fused ATPase/permease subunit